MSRRIVSAFLWFYAGWTFGAGLATMLGVNAVLGVVVGIAAAALFVGDPHRVIWTQKTEAEGSRS